MTELGLVFVWTLHFGGSCYVIQPSVSHLLDCGLVPGILGNGAGC